MYLESTEERPNRRVYFKTLDDLLKDKDGNCIYYFLKRVAKSPEDFLTLGCAIKERPYRHRDVIFTKEEGIYGRVVQMGFDLVKVMGNLDNPNDIDVDDIDDDKYDEDDDIRPFEEFNMEKYQDNLSIHVNLDYGPYEDYRVFLTLSKEEVKAYFLDDLKSAVNYLENEISDLGDIALEIYKNDNKLPDTYLDEYTVRHRWIKEVADFINSI